MTRIPASERVAIRDRILTLCRDLAKIHMGLHPDSDGYVALAAAVIGTAAADLYQHEKYGRVTPVTNGYEIERYAIINTRRWFSDTSEGVGSFIFWCDVIGVNPDAIRSAILRRDGICCGTYRRREKRGHVKKSEHRSGMGNTNGRSKQKKSQDKKATPSAFKKI